MNRYTFSTQTGKAYYCNSIPGFIADRSTDIVGRLIRHAFDINKEQANAWENQIAELQRRLEECGMKGDIIFEYDIVRLGKRIDVILLIRHMVFSLEFKNGKDIFTAQDAQQAEDYAIDIKNFHKESETSVYKGYKQDKIEMRGDRAEMSDFPLYLNTVAGGLDRRDQTIGGFSFVVKIYAVPVVEIIG